MLGKALVRRGWRQGLRALWLSRRTFRAASTPLLNKGNVILMGSPGSGKTTVGQILGEKLGRSTFDIDNDHLEKVWKMPVAEKLSRVGAEEFIAAEGDALMQVSVSDNVVSLSGSNPMHGLANQYIRNTGVTVFLDIPHQDILKRLEAMKVDRIVGQEEGVNMLDILRYRQKFYEGNYDIRVVCEEGETAASIADKVAASLMEYSANPGHVSTRGAYQNTPKPPGFNQVVLEGLAPDGGLYVPNKSIPYMTLKAWQRLVDLSYPERALRVLEKWISPCDLDPAQLGYMIQSSYSAHNFASEHIFPVTRIHSNQYVTELFHGPTASFKDAALQLMPKFFHNAIKVKNDTNKSRYLILVATSGDTGGAVLDGFAKLPNDSGIDVMVLYPEHGISEIQKVQMTTAQGSNVYVLGVNSDFDFCQTAIKDIFKNSDLAKTLYDSHRVILSAANSINWGRLLPQVVYHTSSYLDLVRQGVIAMGDPVDLCIPTGNFGNILAAYYAKEMGIPYKRIICASNRNNVLSEFLEHGVYDLTQRTLQPTSSPAIDILKSSNLERFLYHITGANHQAVSQWFHDLETKKKFKVPKEVLERIQSEFLAGWCSETHCKHTIKNTFEDTGYVLDPHTAVARTVAQRFDTGSCPMLISSTAHHNKFADDVLMALGHSHSVSSKMESRERIQNMFDEVSSLNPQPEQHKMLANSLKKNIVHTDKCEANMEQIINKMNNFLCRPNHANSSSVSMEGFGTNSF